MWQIFTNNGWAKLSAFLITLVLFILVKQINYKERQLVVRQNNVTAIHCPDNLRLNPDSKLVNRDVEVTVSGPAELMIEAERQTYQLTVDLSDMSQGERELPILPSMLSTRDYTRRLAMLQHAVKRFNPATVHVSLLLSTRSYPVVVDYMLERSGEVVVDATSRSTRCEPALLDVTGNTQSLDALDALSPPFVIRCDPVTITDDTPALENDPSVVYMITNLPAELAPQYPDVKPADPEILQVTAYFKLKPRP